MTEALIADLAKISSLKVISRTSVMRYRGTTRPLPEVARELGVDAIIEGSVQRSKDRVRITAQLIDAASDRHLWADSYDRSAQDVLALQSEVARAIAAQVRARVSRRGGGAPGEARSVKPDAYEAYFSAGITSPGWNPESIRYARYRIVSESDPSSIRTFALALGGSFQRVYRARHLGGLGVGRHAERGADVGAQGHPARPDLAEAHARSRASSSRTTGTGPERRPATQSDRAEPEPRGGVFAFTRTISSRWGASTRRSRTRGAPRSWTHCPPFSSVRSGRAL